MKIKSHLQTLLISALFVLLSHQKVDALSQKEIAKISQSITLRIDNKSNKTNGSGIIIKHEGNTYTVLTARHVIKDVNRGAKYEIIAPDGKHYSFDRQTVKYPKQNPGFDLAVFKFTSYVNYSVAKIGNSNQALRQTNTYVGGFPANSQTQDSANFTFFSGIVGGRPSIAVANLEPAQAQGYTLIYTNPTLAGMSGGSVLNEQGELIGIHGREESAKELAIKVERFGERRVITRGYYLGIPINIAFSFFRENHMNVQMYPPSDHVAKTSKADDLFWQSIHMNENGDKKSALAYLDKAIKIEHNYAELYNNRGLLHSDLEDKKAALVDFTEAIEVNPQYIDAYLNRSSIYYKLGDIEKAVVDCNQAIRINPNNADAYNSRGVFNTKLGNTKQAKADFARALELYPKNNNLQLAVVYFNRGNLLKDRGDTKGAISDYNQAIKNDKTYAEAYLNRGSIRDDIGDFQGAIDDYKLAIENEPHYAEAFLSLGATYYKLRKNELAIYNYKQALKLNPDYAEAYYNLGKIKYDSGYKQGAIEDYTKAIQLKPRLSQAYYNRGIAREDIKDEKGAVDDYTQAIKINPNYAEAYNNRGKILFFLDRENKQRGIVDMKKAAELFKQQGKFDEYQKLVKVLEYF